MSAAGAGLPAQAPTDTGRLEKEQSTGSGLEYVWDMGFQCAVADTDRSWAHSSTPRANHLTLYY